MIDDWTRREKTIAMDGARVEVVVLRLHGEPETWRVCVGDGDDGGVKRDFPDRYRASLLYDVLVDGATLAEMRDRWQMREW